MATARLRFATCLAPNVKPMYEFVAAYVGERLGLPADLVECDDYDRYHLAGLGGGEGFFGRVVEAGFHQVAMAMIRRGEADATAIDSQVWKVALPEDPSLAEDLEVIESLGPSSIQPVTVARRLPAELRRGIRETLLAMGDDPAARVGLALGLVERFVPVDDASYDDIRAMRDVADAAGVRLEPEGADARPALS